MKKHFFLTFVCFVILASCAAVHSAWASPYVDAPNPAVNETQVPVDTNISFHLKDDVADISVNSIKVTVQRYGDASATTIIENGAPVLLAGVTDVPAGIDSSDPRDMIISYDPPDHDDYRFGYEQVITVRVEASDAASGALDYSYSFTTIEITQAPNVRVNRATDGDHLQSRMCMDHSGKKVYVVWQKDGGIWFSSSDDRGETFLEEIKISPDDSGTNENPAIAVDEPGNIYVIWQSKKDAETSDLYFCRRLKGEDFEAAKIPVDTAGNESDQMFPAIKAKSSGSVFIAWVNRNDNEGVYYSRADKDSGASLWSAPVIHRVDDASEALPQYPDVGIDSSGHNVIIAWSAEKGGTRNIYFNAFEYVAKDKVDAKLYAADIQINDAAVGGSCDRPRIGNRNNFNGAGSKPGIAVVWENTLAEDNKDIYLDKSVDGAAWGADIRVNDDETQDPALQEAPQVAVDANGDMFLAWADKASGNWDIYSTYSLDAGATFHDVVKFNDNSGSSDQYGPSLFLSANGKNICVSWTDERDGNADIYFGRNTITDEETCMNVDKDVDATVSADASSSIARTQAVIPALALETDTSISVARIYCPPGFIFGKANLNKFVHFGPSGTRFKKNVTIKIPYTLEELAEAGLSSSSPLTIYYYNPKTKAWELVPGTTQDSLNQLVMASVDHFSTFALAEGEAVTSASGGGGGGGGGGCFIATAAFGSYDSPEVKALRIFRDRHLLSSGWGREFVKFYYAHSPSLAEFIKDKPAFKRVVRLFLKPVAAAAAMIPAQ